MRAEALTASSRSSKGISAPSNHLCPLFPPLASNMYDGDSLAPTLDVGMGLETLSCSCPCKSLTPLSGHWRYLSVRVLPARGCAAIARELSYMFDLRPGQCYWLRGLALRRAAASCSLALTWRRAIVDTKPISAPNATSHTYIVMPFGRRQLRHSPPPEG